MTDDTSSTDEDTDATTETKISGKTTVSALDDHTIPLDTVDPMADLDGLADLHDILAENRIVGLGEATHGSREFFRLKHRLLRYLVTELDIRLFGLEANFSEALALNDYVVYGDGDPGDALGGVYFWTWNVESILEMVEWLRTFNADRPVEDRVRFYGFDAQYSQGAVDELIEFFEAVDAAFLTTICGNLETVADEGTPPHLDDHRKARFQAADRVVPVLRNRLRNHKKAYIAETSKQAWELALQHVRIIEQTSEYKQAWHDRQEDNVDEDTAVERCLRIRERAMADNIDWVREHENADCTAIWGHDAHINRSRNVSRQTDVTVTSVGGHLAARHGDDYYALGFSFGHGSFQAISEVQETEGNEQSYSIQEQTVAAPLPNTIEVTLAELEYPLVIVDIRTAIEDENVAEWLSGPQRHFSVGATYDPDNPEEFVTEYAYADAFDGVCYIDETTRARLLEQN